MPEDETVRPTRGRPQINGEQTMARFGAGTLARIKAVLRQGEPQSSFIRAAVEAELDRREAAARGRDGG